MIDARTLTLDFTLECLSDTCAEGVSLWGRCQHSNVLLPLPPCGPSLTGHPHPRSGRHARSPSDSALHAALPLSSQPPRPHAVPPRSPAAQLVRDPCGLTGARGTCGQLPILPAASSAAVHVGEVGLASVHVVHAVRRGGSSSLPQAHSGEKRASAAAMWGNVGVV